MRINGRTLRPSTLAERRLMHALGVQQIRVSRRDNPYVVARRLSRAARQQTPDHLFVREVIARSVPVPRPSPEPDHSGQEPHFEAGHAGPEGAADHRAA